MIKVCHISSAHPRYDVRIFIKECLSLVKSGEYDVNLVIADGQGDEVNQGVQIHDVGANKNGRLGRMIYTPQKIYTKVLELRPQIVHFHDPELMLIGIKLAKKGFKVIYDVHENLPKQVLTKYWIPTILRKSIAVIVNRLELYTAKRISGVISVLEPIIERFKYINSNTTILYNYPIIDDIAGNQDVVWSKRNNSLVYVGGISKIRGIEPLIDSLAISGLKLELAGSFSGSPDLESKLRAKPGWSLVNYHGLVSHNSATKIIEMAKIGIVTLFAVPSYAESLPIKMFEYMSSGIPIIATNIPFWQNLIEKYNCALFIDPTDPVAIANSCKWLLENDEIAQQMGERGRQAILEHFNWNREADKLLALYKQIL